MKPRAIRRNSSEHFPTRLCDRPTDIYVYIEPNVTNNTSHVNSSDLQPVKYIRRNNTEFNMRFTHTEIIRRIYMFATTIVCYVQKPHSHNIHHMCDVVMNKYVF